jgi:hypothetical protein
MRRTLLPRIGYREAATYIQLWLLGALISHLEFDVVDFLICEIEDTVLDGLRARRQLPYAHYLCHIFAQLIRPPQFQGTLEASRLLFGSYRPAPEDPMPALALVIDTQAEDTTFHQFETQGAAVPDDDDDDDVFRVPLPPPPPMPPRSHDHEARSSSAAPAAPPAIDPALAAILQTLLSSRLTWQPSRPVRQRFRSRCLRECYRCFRLFGTYKILYSSNFWQTGLRTGPS